MKIAKIVIGIGVVVGLVLTARTLIEKKKQEEASLSVAKKYAIVVKSITPKITNKILGFNYLAEVKNDKEITINSKFAGKIISIKNLGDKVKKGEIIAQIDNSDLKAKLNEVNSKISSIKDKLKSLNTTLQNLKLTHNRTKKLLAVKMASIEEFQNEENKLSSLQSEIKSNENSLNALISSKNAILNDLTYTKLKSPIDGIISSKFLNKDDNTFPAKPIVKITPINGNYLFIALPKIYKNIIYKNREYNLTPLKATYNSLLTFKAFVGDNSLVTGQKVDIEVVEYQGEGTFLPYDAILSVNDENYILTPKPIKVKILAQGKKFVLIDKNITQNVVLAKPDVLLKIKAGYPVKMEK